MRQNKYRFSLFFGGFLRIRILLGMVAQTQQSRGRQISEFLSQPVDSRPVRGYIVRPWDRSRKGSGREEVGRNSEGDDIFRNNKYLGCFKMAQHCATM